ncbi:hypothetical protein [Rhizobium leguminosarum]|uniref:hypothetical protein n=1 Tax=Rhizobium leguminosarum TaxID=384 RepID=UPI0039658CB9
MLRETETQAVIPLKANRKNAIPCDFAIYFWRHVVENSFSDLKQFRGIATRYDSFEAFILRAIHLAIR